MVFRSRAVKSREMIDFPNPVKTKIVEKKSFPQKYSRAFSVHGNTKRDQHAHRVLVPTWYVARTQSPRTYQIRMMWYGLFKK